MHCHCTGSICVFEFVEGPHPIGGRWIQKGSANGNGNGIRETVFHKSNLCVYQHYITLHSITLLFVFLLWRCCRLSVFSFSVPFVVVDLFSVHFEQLITWTHTHNHTRSLTSLTHIQIYYQHSDWIVFTLVISILKSVKMNINNLLSAHNKIHTEHLHFKWTTLWSHLT